MPPLYFDPESVSITDIEETPDFQTPEGMLPLVKLLLDDDFDFQKGEFPKIRLSDWSPEEGLRVGKIVAKELLEMSPPQPLTQRIITRLHVLGLFPDFNFIRKNYDSLHNFNEKVGAATSANSNAKNRKYDELSRAELLAHIVNTYDEMVEVPDDASRKPLSAITLNIMYQHDLIPSDAYLLRRLGGVRKINEMLGFPNIKSWDNETYLQYGADILRLNGPDSLTVSNSHRLALEKFGPHPAAIKARFGSWGRFKNLAQEHLRNEESLIANHQASVEEYYRQQLPDNEDVPFSEKALHRALWLLVGHYFKTQPLEIPERVNEKTVTKVVNEIRERSKGNSTLADIEITALMLNIFDDLWPTQQEQQRQPILANLKPRYKNPRRK